MYADTPRRSSRRRPDLNINTSPPPAAYSNRPAAVVASRGEPTTAPPVPQTPPPSNRNRPPPPPPTSSSSVAKGKSNSSRALRGPALSRHADDSFLVDTPDSPDSFDMSSNKENDNPDQSRPRDSHDLSLSPRNVTRDSLMANMLMSLDQFSMGGPVGGPFGSSPPNMHDEPSQQYQYDTDGDGFSRSVRGGRAGHTYSYSSDFDADDASRISSRGRRSNSSSNFQPGLHRISSMREPLRSTANSQRHMHSRGGKGSTKSSSSNSIDAGYAQVLSSTRWASGFGGRSSSFDYGHRPPALQATQHQAQANGAPWHIEFSNTFFTDDYDAAPTPTVPGGPRRMMPPVTPPAATIPQQPMAASTSAAAHAPSTVAVEPAEPPPIVLERKRSSRSAKSTSTSRRADNNNKSSTPREEVPPMPSSVPVSSAAPISSPATAPVTAFESESAPAPHVGYGKTKEPVHAATIPTQAPSQQTKEKPGFFRRVFGSSRSNASNNPPETQNSTGITSSTSVDSVDQRSGNRSLHVANQMKPSAPAPPSRDTSSSHSHHHVLQKKPSSFFRRRKKSVSADEVPPVPVAATLEPPMPPLVAPIQLPITKDKLSAKPEPSPISSLRRVMNPYLKGSPVTPNTPLTPQPAPVQPAYSEMTSDPAPASNGERAEEQPRSFSPEYDPSPNARIREVRSGSRDDDDDYHPEHERRTDTPTRPPPEPPISSEKRNNSFLDIDGSDNEADTESKRGKTKRDRSHKSGKTSKEPSPSRKGTSDRKDDTIRGRKNNRLAVAPADSDDEGNKSTLILPMEGTRSASRASGSTTTEYKSAMSGTPSVRVETTENSPKVLGTFEAMSTKPLDEPDFVVGDPTEDDRQKAQKIYDGNEDFIQKEKAAAWMGEEGPVRQRTLQAYMDLYDFADKSILQSLRLICERLVFRAETQQVDRILVAFSKRWCDCNTNHGFKASDVIHTICYSIMLLNTDLHLADIEHKMTRSQFVKNTMTTITQAVIEAAPDAFERPTILPGKSNSALGGDDSRPSIEERFVSRRLSFRPPPRNEGDGSGDHCHDECGPLVKSPFDGSMRAWESQVEVVLKDIYASIRDERLPLFGADPSKNLAPNTQSGLSVIGMLKRTPSVLSKAPSESQASMRGRIAENGRANSSRWNSKSRSRPRMGNPGFSSSRTSFEDGNSIWSPTISSATWSKLSLGRTQTSMSVDSLSSSFRGGDYQQSIGFANALSQAVIRDDESCLGKEPSIMSDELKPAQLLDDESLELAGPPWVKEGMVIHKHHLDGIEKKAKDRHWNEVFAVIQRGQMSIFSFGTNKTGRKGRSRNATKGPAIVGGGNWQENATNLGTFSLRQTLASTLPPPGYSRARPHVWALSLPTGAVHLFQVGTPEISKEFVTTANYWSARLSTHPLVGGISNIEYGWSDAIINNALVTAINEQTVGPATGRQRSNSRPGSSAAGNPRPSMSSFRSAASLDHGSGGPYSSASRGNKLPGDRIHVAEWAPPTQSMRPSNLPEEEQLESLLAYVKGIEDELQTHNQLRSPMLLAFTPRGNNAVRAMTNWERKSAYLLREIVKFRTYVDCLQQAETRKTEIYGERDLARRAARGELDEGEIEFDVERDTPIRT
ncbi:Sec7 domain-containing protein [Colletotrichum scovillei]|uniref:Sec7 domain-containing protein n=1 Tax=Colletotrichum scovillei TaxID=1209932 RepID=A0A9P7UCK3_9PEZI|nr:Sec7 domain-containing protein [Colletotrichum scovillei]KAF4775221.1 Sec7 domain-containing protein [Colletotrichum scovillei]KAG7042561.1 Sec7 domain-containing protein [Colletotrichum scovillei]KAG7043152.1 Sec7 domain-containing protein [Colletotrichum scovillei]KAG7062600.1 Sec7 domain-containing protein [Colletotrichum scovillei]